MSAVYSGVFKPTVTPPFIAYPAVGAMVPLAFTAYVGRTIARQV